MLEFELQLKGSAMKVKVSIPTLLCAYITAVASADTLYPVYTVTSNAGGGATNYLESSVIQIVDSEGATPREVAYADIDKSAGNFSGTFVIEADSYLMGSVTMTNFTGEIRIKSGALIVDAVGWLGVADVEQAPKLYVESGATLMPTCPVTRGGKIYNELHLAGDGYNGLGALCCSYRAGHTDYCIYNHIYLEDDATIGMRTTYRVDMYTSADFYLQNHTLTFKDVRKTRTTALPTFCPYASRFIPGSGHVEVDHVILQVQGPNSKGWGGTAENTLVFYNDSSLNFYNTQIPIPWTFVIRDGETIVLSDSSNDQSRFYRDFPATNSNYYAGPVRLNGALKLTRNSPYTFTRGVCLSGDISGSGSLDSPNGWLQLMGSNTAYSGTICVRNGDAAYGGLALWREDAASIHSAGYFLTNAPLKLVAEGRLVGGEKIYDLPPINFHVDSFTNFEIGANVWESNIVDVAASGGMNARMASLKKTGDGELALVANFDITGRTEIAGGTLRLAPASRYSALPGLWEGIFETNETATAELVAKYNNQEIGMNDLPMYVKYNDTVETLSNRVTSSAYLFARKGSPYWHYMMAPTYTGYIWNRESTNITVTFAGAIVDAWKIYLRGTRIASLYDGSEMGTKAVTLYPGANAIMLRGWNRNSTAPGWFKPSNKQDWNLPYMGFAMAYGNTSSDYDASHYFVPMNGMAACAGGDGIMFTRDARTPEEFTAEELSTTRATIADLAMSGGGILDLSGSPLFIKSLEGAGTVTNGSLTVKEIWSLGYSDIVSGNALAVDGAMTFADGATIAFDDQNARPNAGIPVPFAIVTAKDGVTGNPSFSCGKKNWRMELSGDGRSLMAVCYPKGITISFK